MADQKVLVVGSEEGEEVDSKRRELVVRQQLEQCRNDLEENYITLCKLLHETYENAYYLRWGFVSLKEYAEKELGFKYRKARYFISIAEAVKRCGLKWEDIQSIGWTSMRAIARVMTPDDAAMWIERAGSLTADQLNSQVSELLQTGVTPEGSPVIMSMQLRMNQDESTIIMDAVERAKNLIETESTVKALEHICYEFTQQSGEGPQKSDLQTCLRYIEQSFGVRLTPVEQADLTQLVGGL